MPNGFYISRLMALGPEVCPAEVTFLPGCNVIAGASDTGKSYVLQCLNYMMGAKDPPKSVPEDAGYDTLRLEIRTWDDEPLVLQRSLKKGGHFRLYHMALADVDESASSSTLRWKHDPTRQDTLSAFLLDLCGISSTVIQKTKSGKVRALSFRDICRFSIVDETSIISERSPLLPSGQLTKATEEKSVFAFLVSGEDASSVVPPPDIKAEKARWKGRSELYDTLIDELSREVAHIDHTLDERISAIEMQISSATDTIAQDNRVLEQLTARRRDAWQAASRARFRVSQIDQMVRRFILLKDHYESDLQRLEFVSEGDFFLSQLGESHCPICGSLLEEHDPQHLKTDEEIRATIQEASRTEADKLRQNLEDLAQTISAMESERADYQKIVDHAQNQVREWDEEIAERLQPRIVTTRELLDELVESRSALVIAREKKRRLQELAKMKEELGPEPREKRNGTPVPSTASESRGRRHFCDALEARLRSWRYAGAGTVEFDEKSDIVVGGDARRTHGKGIRAILQSAFTVTLMAQFHERHPKFVVLDSPLTSFKERDKYEVSEDVQAGVYEDLARTPKDQQVIIIENKSPPEEVREQVNYIHFSGSTDTGRAGFFPVQN